MDSKIALATSSTWVQNKEMWGNLMRFVNEMAAGSS